MNESSQPNPRKRIKYVPFAPIPCPSTSYQHEVNNESHHAVHQMTGNPAKSYAQALRANLTEEFDRFSINGASKCEEKPGDMKIPADIPVRKSYATAVSADLMDEFDRLARNGAPKCEVKLEDMNIPGDVPVGLQVFYRELKLWEYKRKTFQAGTFYPYKLFE